MMKKHIIIFATLIFFAVNTFAKTSPGLGKNIKSQQSTGISFTENKGQIHDQNYKPRPDVLYGVMTGNMSVHIKNNGVSYQLYKSPSPTFPRGERASSACSPQAPFSPGEGRGG